MPLLDFFLKAENKPELEFRKLESKINFILGIFNTYFMEEDGSTIGDPGDPIDNVYFKNLYIPDSFLGTTEARHYWGISRGYVLDLDYSDNNFNLDFSGVAAYKWSSSSYNPVLDDVVTLGLSSARWSTVYAYANSLSGVTTATNFKKIFDGYGHLSSIFTSDGTDPDTVLTGSSGDRCLDLTSSTVWRCSGTTSWQKIGANVNHSFKDVNSATYTLTKNDYYIGVSYTSTGSVVLTVPEGSTLGKISFKIKDTGYNAFKANITINFSGSDTVDDGVSTSIVIKKNGGAVEIVYDGSGEWFIFGGA